MPDAARDPAALELLRVQRGRLADRMRPPWWYLTGAAIVWALVFAVPFSSRYLPQGVRIWPILVAGVALTSLLQWGLTRATGISVGMPDLTYRPGRPAGIAMAVVSIAGLGTEASLIRHGLIVVAIVVAALAVAAQVAAQQVLLRAIRQDLRGGGEAA